MLNEPWRRRPFLLATLAPLASYLFLPIQNLRVQQEQVCRKASHSLQRSEWIPHSALELDNLEGSRKYYH